MMKSLIDTNMRKITTVLLTLAFIGAGSFTALMLKKPVCVRASDNILERANIFLFDTQDELEERRNEREAAVAQAQAASSRVAALAGQASALSGELAELNQLSEEQREQYEIISSQLAAALVAKTEALDAYIDAQENLEATELLFQERLSVMFEYQNKSALEVLLESDSIAGFFTNMEIITLISDADAQAVDQMEVALENAEMQREIALAEADEMQQIADEKQAQLDELEARIGITTEALADISCELDSWTAQENSLEALAASLDQQIVALQAQYDAEVAAAATATTATSATTSMTSETFESSVATDPLDPNATPTVAQSVGCTTAVKGIAKKKKKRRFDIGAGFGDTIMAAASGTVIYVETPVPGQNWGGSGYGNYFIIDHGNGVSTLYAHCSNVYVSNGQSVSAGEAVGTVGSTGGSTGSHLHFEVRVNGDRVDPLGCLP